MLGEKDDQSWYLNYVGTKIGSRGKGYAKRLIQHIGAVVSLQCSLMEKSVLTCKGGSSWTGLLPGKFPRGESQNLSEVGIRFAKADLPYPWRSANSDGCDGTRAEEDSEQGVQDLSWRE